MKLKHLIPVATLAFAMLVWPAAGTASSRSLSTARAGTAVYHDVNVALADGYGLFTDAAGIACIDNPAGGMGVHFVKGALVGDAAVEAATPEALVYEPQPNGRLRLVAAEYVVFQATWDAVHASPPSLFGQE